MSEYNDSDPRGTEAETEHVEAETEATEAGATDDDEYREREQQAERGTPGVNPETADDTGDEFISVDEVTFSRDDDGNLLAEDVFVEELDGMARSRPLMKEQRERIVEPFIDPEGHKDEITDADLADLFNSRLEKPDLTEHPHCPDSRVTERFVEDHMPQSMQDGCFIAVLLASKEFDLIRILRNELKESEIEIAVRSEQAENETKNERRKRRRKNMG